MTDLRSIEQLEGRVLGHGEEESTGRTYMLIEGTDRLIHFVYHTPEFERARQKGKWQSDSFLRVIIHSAGNKAVTSVEDLGDATRLLENKQYFRKKARALIRHGILPVEAGIGGWLGRYEAELARALRETDLKSLEVNDRKPPRMRGD